MRKLNKVGKVFWAITITFLFLSAEVNIEDSHASIHEDITTNSNIPGNA